MAKQTINLGTLADGSDGDTNRTAWGKANSNFDELYNSSTTALGFLGFKNLLINALGTINQRGYVSGTATTAANQYTADRWKVQTSGQSVSWTTSGGVTTFTAPAGGFAQVIEGVNVQGGAYTLSWTGSATATVNGSAVANGGQVALPANTNATVVFFSGTLSLPQLELGSESTAFDWRPLAIETVLAQRYYQQAYLVIEINTKFQSMFLPVTMRAIPSITGGGSGFVVATPGTAALNVYQSARAGQTLSLDAEL